VRPQESFSFLATWISFRNRRRRLRLDKENGGTQAAEVKDLRDEAAANSEIFYDAKPAVSCSDGKH